MKKHVFIFLCGLIMSVSAFAQTSVTVKSPHMFRRAEKTIIKECRFNYPATITCSNSEESVTFIYADASMQVIERTIEGYYVNDMVLTRDSVFFCGRDNNNNGIIGSFQINSFFNLSGAVSLETNLSTYDSYSVKELTRILRFEDINNVIHLACIGTCENDENTYPCIVDMGAAFNPYYTVGYIAEEKEAFTDIKLVSYLYSEYYVVTAGYDNTAGQYINLRIYDLNNLFSLSGPQNMCHVYCMSPSTVPYWYDSDVLLSDISGNTFATVSHRSSNTTGFSSGNDTCIINLAFYNIGSLLSNSVYALVANYESTLGVTTELKMNQFICSNLKNRLAFLHTYDTAFSSNYISEYYEVDLSTLSSSGTFWRYNNPGTKQYGLSLYGSNSKYILSGHDILTPTTLKYQMNTFGTISNCAEINSPHYEKVRTIESANFKRDFVTSSNQSTTITDYAERVDLPIYIECETK